MTMKVPDNPIGELVYDEDDAQAILVALVTLSMKDSGFNERCSEIAQRMGRLKEF